MFSHLIDHIGFAGFESGLVLGRELQVTESVFTFDHIGYNWPWKVTF